MFVKVVKTKHKHKPQILQSCGFNVSADNGSYSLLSVDRKRKTKLEGVWHGTCLPEQLWVAPCTFVNREVSKSCVWNYWCSVSYKLKHSDRFVKITALGIIILNFLYVSLHLLPLGRGCKDFRSLRLSVLKTYCNSRPTLRLNTFLVKQCYWLFRSSRVDFWDVLKGKLLERQKEANQTGSFMPICIL